MKKFRFRLDQVLHVRRVQEDRARAELLTANRDANLAAARVEERLADYAQRTLPLGPQTFAAFERAVFLLDAGAAGVETAPRVASRRAERRRGPADRLDRRPAQGRRPGAPGSAAARRNIRSKCSAPKTNSSTTWSSPATPGVPTHDCPSVSPSSAPVEAASRDESGSDAGASDSGFASVLAGVARRFVGGPPDGEREARAHKARPHATRAPVLQVRQVRQVRRDFVRATRNCRASTSRPKARASPRRSRPRPTRWSRRSWPPSRQRLRRTRQLRPARRRPPTPLRQRRRRRTPRPRPPARRAVPTTAPTAVPLPAAVLPPPAADATAAAAASTATAHRHDAPRPTPPRLRRRRRRPRPRPRSLLTRRHRPRVRGRR